MIKLINLTKHEIARTANPKYIALADIFVPDSNTETKQMIAKYVIETYDLGELDGVKGHVSRHILDFTYLVAGQRSRVTGQIEYDA
ncbi:hypothetical protein [Leuconostoc miyukkimchii]|uniref:hypothetical protein n=1 Tax=Leuconostoc miyukkimchii TaxID=910540 RepID=UPI001C7DD600|nr:hypothetical protein [Leuconostoc miyukkimchii]